MDKFSGQKRAAQFLFPSIDPFDSMMLQVGKGHEVYVERCGNPKGKTVIVLHGGPGGGCSPVMRRYFDPTKYHIILFDQFYILGKEQKLILEAHFYIQLLYNL